MPHAQSASEASLAVDARFCAPESVLKGQVSRMLKELRAANPSAKRSDAQEALARVWGRPDWHALQKNARDAHGAGLSAADARGSAALAGSNAQTSGNPLEPAASASSGRPRSFCPRNATREEWLDLVDFSADLGPAEPAWKAKAVAFCKGLVGVHFDLHPGQPLPAKALRGSMSLKALAKWNFDRMENTDRLPKTPAGDAVRRHLSLYPHSWDPEGGGEWASAAEQNGYAQMQFEAAWEMLENLDQMADLVISRPRWVLTSQHGQSEANDLFRHTWLALAGHKESYSLLFWARDAHGKGVEALTLGDLARLGVDAMVPEQRDLAIHWLRQPAKMARRAREFEQALALPV